MSESTVSCPTCGGGKKQMISNSKKREGELIDTAFANVPYVPRLPINKIIPDLPISSVSSAFKGGKCPDCGGKGTAKDGSDISKKVEAAEKAASAAKETMSKHEAELGPPGGDTTRVISGNETVQIGLVSNKAKSYATVPGGQQVPSKVHIGEKGSAAGHATTDYVHGTNPLATPGGTYTLNVSNKISIICGAQGIDMNTNGPININGGITKITAPQMTIGSSTGTMSVEGKHTQITGGTVALNATDGDQQVHVQGSLGVQANVVIGGSLHTDGDVSMTSATMPSKLARTKFAGAPDKGTGQANWRMTGAAHAAKDMGRTVSLFSADPSLVMMTPRGQQVTMQKMRTLAYAMMPLEMQTGICIVPGCGVGMVFNFPHVHSLADGAHTHDMEVPNIKTVDSDEDLRKAVGNKQASTPIPSNSEDTMTPHKLVGVIGGIASKMM